MKFVRLALSKLYLHKLSILEFEGDVMVTAANSALAGGSGVDGAIHKAAGSELALNARRLAPCKTGEVKVTESYNLKRVQYIAHTVGPVWQDGQHNEEALLQSCYRKACDFVVENQLSSIAFPAISCGRYRFPTDAFAKNFMQVMAEPKYAAIEKHLYVVEEALYRLLKNGIANGL